MGEILNHACFLQKRRLIFLLLIHILGVHVASRWFSSGTARFMNFQHSPIRYPDNYPKSLQYVMKSEPYHAGGTNTATALDQVYKSDLPTSRRKPKDQTFVVIFTDGASGNNAATVQDKIINEARITMKI